MAGDRAVHQQLVDRAPGLVVGRARHARQRRAGHDLPPEESLEVGARAVSIFQRRRSRQHAVGDVEIVPAVAVEIERVRRPRPAPHLGVRLERPVLEAAVAEIPQQRVAAGVAAIERAHVGRRIGHERRRRGHAPPRRGPHVAGIDVEPAVVVVVEERGAHAGAVIERPRGRGHVLERHLAVARARGCDRGSWSRSRSRPGGPASRPRRSRPRRRRSGSGRCRRRGRRRGSLRRSARARRCGRACRAVRCARRSTAPAFPPCPRRRRRNTSRRTGRGRGSRRDRSRPSRSTSARPAADGRTGRRREPG